MSIQSSEKGQIFNEINITPLTDIFLVLLIIMMVMAPMFQSVDKNIKQPEINSGVAVENDDVTVSVTKEGEFFVNGQKINSDQLESTLQPLVNKVEKKIVVVKADTNTKNKEIMKIMNAATVVGFEKLTVAGEPLSKKEQNKLKEQIKKPY